MSSIKNKFPYKGSEKIVTEDMCDVNGHMNVAYYLRSFDVYSRPLFEEIGFDQDYFKAGFSTFALEDSIRYLKEFTLNQTIYSRFRVIDANHKLIHFVGILLNKDEELAAISETIVAHVDMSIRKTIDMPGNIINSVNQVIDKHNQFGALDFDLRLGLKHK
ncbi:MAG: thioesterase [Gammaproteobacteria bacterium]|jgi:acyl-CoA thioester hydrolase|nr:thioesterase [Gammaproteobacteria bacterium]